MDIHTCVCVCVCERERICVCVCMCVCMCVRVNVCVCDRECERGGVSMLFVKVCTFLRECVCVVE
jgi:hypothetical protein